MEETGLVSLIRAELFAEWAKGEDWDGVRNKLNLLATTETIIDRMCDDD